MSNDSVLTSSTFTSSYAPLTVDSDYEEDEENALVIDELPPSLENALQLNEVWSGE